ncbi:MAG: hypothetical protein ABSG01_05415 [Anaerolineales bacterium]|jgi:hypothetical protein
MRKRIADWVNILNGVYSDKKFIMVTLTYAPEYKWEPNHIRAFMLSMRKLLGNSILAYAWVAELQKRLAIHYHIMFLVPIELEIGEDFPYPDQAGIWTYGFTRVEIARSPFYLVTYLGKEYQKDFSKFPKGIRVFAVYIHNSDAKIGLRFQSLRPYQQELVNEFGWSELSSLIKLRKDILNEENLSWRVWSFEKDKKSAIEQAEGWENLEFSWKGRPLFAEEERKTL